MTVAENMFLGREPRRRNLIVDERAVNQEAQVILDYLRAERCADHACRPPERRPAADGGDRPGADPQRPVNHYG